MPQLSLKTPDITPAQIVSAIGFIAAQAVAFGLLDEGTAQLIVSIGGTAVPLIWTIADAIIRNGRAKVAAAQVLAPVPKVGEPRNVVGP
jgi:hypothetical protein